MQIEQKICEIIERSLSDLGYELVRVKYFNRGRRNILQIMIERMDQRGIVVNDCETVSHTVSALLDVEDPISNAYDLEVSSPGIDRPLVKLKDFTNHKDFEVILNLFQPIDNNKRLQGKIIEVISEDITINSNGTDYKISLKEIDSAKLALTDELLKRNLAISN